MKLTNLILSMVLCEKRYLPIIVFISTFHVFHTTFASEYVEECCKNVDEIVAYVIANDSSHAYQLLKIRGGNSNNDIKIRLNEKVTGMNGESSDYSEWILGKYSSEKNGFVLALPIGMWSYISTLSSDDKIIKECEGSMVSNGKKVALYSKKSIVTYEWSCGSMGCSYYYGFYDYKETKHNILDYCK